MNENQELIVIENLDPAKLFAGEGLDELLSSVEKHVNSLHHDISTAMGRTALASFCRSIAGSKNALDKLGKDHVDHIKKGLKDFDTHRRRAKLFLQKLQDDKRQPLTDWEDAEEARAEAIADRIEAIKALVPDETSLSRGAVDIGEIEANIKELENLVIDEGFGEMAQTASTAKEESLQILTAILARMKKQADEMAELDRLRKIEAEQKQKDHDEQIRRQAEADAEARTEREKQAAIDAKEKAEQDARDAVEAGKRQKEAAEQRAESAKIEADKQVKQAAQAERDRIAAEKKAEDDATAARERNTQHKGRVNRGIVIAIIKAIPSASEAEAKRLVTDMAKGDITNVTINY